MLYSNINKNRFSLSMIEEILDIEEVGLTLLSSTDEVFASLDEFQIPYKGKSTEEVLKFLFDRLLYEYMEDQSYYDKESYGKFKNTLVYNQLQILIYHVKSLLLWLYNNDINQIPRSSKRLLKKKDINPVDETNYIEEYEHYKLYMDFVEPNILAQYFNNLVGLKHFSVKTKAIYHAFVEELELRDINYDIMLYGNETMLSYCIDIVTKDNRLTVVRK